MKKKKFSVGQTVHHLANRPKNGKIKQIAFRIPHQTNYSYSNFSYRVVSTLLLDIFRKLVIPYDFTFQLSKITFRIYFLLSRLFQAPSAFNIADLSNLVQKQRATDIVVFPVEKSFHAIFQTIATFERYWFPSTSIA